MDVLLNIISMLFILGGVAIFAAIWAATVYNNLVTLRNRADEGWSDIDVQLKRRYDLIPNLVETVKGYAAHEQSVLEAVIAARTKASSIAMDGSSATDVTLANIASAQDGITSSLGKLFALAENYPDLKANQNFAELQRELADTEDKIQAARRFYNSTVRDLNAAIDHFPDMLFVSLARAEKRAFFEIADAAQREPVSVAF